MFTFFQVKSIKLLNEHECNSIYNLVKYSYKVPPTKGHPSLSGQISDTLK
jgi:hypothetical protein